MEKNCDVLIIGAGPAGSSAARSAAMHGAKTIFIDKKEEIGKPVQCAEGIGAYLFPYLPFQIPNEHLVWKMDGMYFQADDIAIEKKGDFWKSYSCDRRNFDRWLSHLATEKGANLIKKAELTDLELDEENTVKKAIVHKDKKAIEIKPQTVIAADGVESTVLKLLKLYHPKNGDLAEVYSWEMKNLDLYKPNLEQVFTGDFTPSGYAYIFPKGKHTANIGVGGIYPEKKLETYFEEFLENPHVKKQVKNADFVIEKTKKAVWNDLTKYQIIQNVILSGDVANHNLKPFIEGILPAIISGNAAGKTSADFIKNKKNKLSYSKTLNEEFIKFIKDSEAIKEITTEILKQKNKKKYLQFFGIITELLHFQNLMKTYEMSYEEIKSMIIGMKNGL